MLAETDRSALIEELARAAIGKGLGEAPGPEAHRRSPACGDEVRIRLVIHDDRLTTVRWDGHGCVVSTAAASALSATASDLELDAFRELAARYLGSLDADADAAVDAAVDNGLGDLEAFAGIGRYPLRAGCASLAWRAALDALA